MTDGSLVTNLTEDGCRGLWVTKKKDLKNEFFFNYKNMSIMTHN